MMNSNSSMGARGLLNGGFGIPLSSRRDNLSAKDWTLKAVKRILNKLTLENYVRLKNQLIEYDIEKDDVLKGVVSLIVDKAVLDPTSCSICALLCSDLHFKFRPDPLAEICDDPIEFKELLLNSCRDAFEGAGKLRQMPTPEQETEQRDEQRLRRLGSIRLIGELLKQRMVPGKFVHRIARKLLGDDDKACPEVEDIEAICQLFNSIGKHLDEKPKSERIIDTYFNRLSKLYANSDLPARLRFMVRDVLDLCSNDWVPRPEEVKAKRLRTEIHLQDEKNLRLCPGSTTSTIRNQPMSFGPEIGGMMPQMLVGPSMRLTLEDLKIKTTSLLEEYFSVRLLDRALQCIEELRSPSYHPEIVKESVSLGLEKNPPMVEPVFKLLEYLLTKKVLGSYDVRTGCARYASLLEDLAIDLPKAPFNFGLILGKLMLISGLDFDVVRDIIAKFKDDDIRKEVFHSVMDVVSSYLAGNSQSGYDVAA